MLYNFNYKLTEEDFIKFNVYHLKKSDTKKTRIITRMICIMGLIFVTYMLIIGLLASVLNIWNVFMVLLFIVSLAVVAYSFGFSPLVKAVVRGQINDLKKTGKLPFGHSITISFDEEGVHEVSELAESKVKYSNFEKILEDEDAVYIYYSTRTAYFIPHHVFENEQQKTDFLSFIKRKVPGK